MFEIFIVAVGGALGAVARYLTAVWIKSQSTHVFPFNTLVVNVGGCLVMGVLMSLIEKAVPFHRHVFLIGVTGFLGSYTTFSAFGFETFHLIRSDQIGLAMINVFGNIILGLGAVWCGRLLGGG